MALCFFIFGQLKAYSLQDLHGLAGTGSITN
jgi:hypothetical protein